MSVEFREGRQTSGISSLAILSLILLLLFPAVAVLRLVQTFDFRFVIGHVVLISGVTYLFYGHDKRRAQSGGWRTPESTLHLLEFLGGWPAAFLAQRAFRHKISKAGYQLAFWTIVAIHEFAAFDFVHGWQYSRRALLLFSQ
jgi:uncharacterized membrane protein YsdA (DUF1294 family)